MVYLLLLVYEQEGLGIHINITTGRAVPKGDEEEREDNGGGSFESRLIFSQPPLPALTEDFEQDNSIDDETEDGSRNFRPDARGRRRLDEERLVTTPTGTVRGEAFVSPAGVEYYRFDGIPYAEPPVGVLRFRPPVKKRPTARGVLNSNRTAGAKCLQESITIFHSTLKVMYLAALSTA